MNATITAKVLEIREARTITDKFSVQEIIVESDGKYPQKVMIQFINDKIELVNSLNINDLCVFNLNIRGSEYTQKSGVTSYFTNLNCWSLEDATIKSSPLEQELQMVSKNGVEDDGLPF